MVFIPIADTNPRVWIRYHYVTVTIIGLCVAIYVLQTLLEAHALNSLAYGLGLIPASLFGVRDLSPDLYLVPAPLTLVTSMFLHGSPLHLLGNMLFLWVFGDNIEDSMGHGRFAVFYLLCGSIGGLIHSIWDPASVVPTIGASGAVAGVLGAYLILHPKVKVWGIFFIPFPLRFPTYIVLGGWIALEVADALIFSDPARNTVAVWAHIGGFAAGAGLIRFFKYSHVPLWDKSDEGVPQLRGLTLPSWRRGPWGGS